MKLVSRLAAFAAIVACALSAARPAAAAVTVFDNMANGTNGFFGVAPTAWIGERFKSDATNLRLTDVTMRFSAPIPGPYTLSLYSDVAGVPGTSLATLFSGNTANGDVHYSVNALTAPSTTYWIVAGSPTGSTINTGWGASSTLTGTGTGFFPLVASSSNQGASWSTRGDIVQQMQVIANAVPEPSALATLSLLATACLKRRRWN
jgi:hypothetical protein